LGFDPKSEDFLNDINSGDIHMMLSKKVSLLAGAVALVGAVYMPQAGATTYNIGPFTNQDSGFASASGLSAGNFSDMFKFTITGGDAVFTATGNSITASLSKGTQIKTFDLYDGATKLATGSVSSTANAVGSGQSYASIVNYSPMIAGKEYTISVTGSVLASTAAGKGNYSLSLSTAPVPEPEEWAMMLVGAGLVSYQVRRKQKGLSQASLG